MNRRSDVSVEDFLKRLADSGILSPQQLKELPGTVVLDRVDNAHTLAAELVGHDLLTKWQSETLCGEAAEPLAIGDYLVLDHVGDGGMGRVFKARPKDSNRTVAVKLLHPQAASDDSAVRRFEREIEAATRLKHGNIVSTLGSGEHDGQPFLVMEFVSGRDLAALVRNDGPLPVGTAVDCILPTARGLEYAHGLGVVHRDIKPSNLLLSDKVEIRILDMGLARFTTSADQEPGLAQTDITRTGMIMGTVDYMAPEQAANAKNADARSDIYSLGCTLHFLLTGEPPFKGETMMEVLLAHREQSAPSLRSRRDDVPESLEAIYQRMIAREPAERYESMSNVIADIEACQRENGMAWLMQRVKAIYRR